MIDLRICLRGRANTCSSVPLSGIWYSAEQSVTEQRQMQLAAMFPKARSELGSQSISPLEEVSRKNFQEDLEESKDKDQ